MDPVAPVDQQRRVGGTRASVPRGTAEVSRRPLLRLARPVCGCVLLLIMGSCGGSCGPKGPPQESSGIPLKSTMLEPPSAPPPSWVPAAVASLEIVPNAAQAELSSTFSIRGIARAADGTPLAYPPSFSWSSSTLTLEPTGGTEARVKATAVGVHSIRLVAGGVTTHAEIIVESTPVSEDRVSVPHAAGDPVTVAWIPADTGTDSDPAPISCRDDLVVRFAGTASLGQNLLSGCHNSIAVFAPGHAPVFECEDATGGMCTTIIDARWTNGSDEISPSLPTIYDVGVVAWNRSDGADVEVKDDLANGLLDANSVFASQRAGIQLVLDAGAGSSDGSMVDFSSTAEDACADLSQLSLIPTPGVLNIVYVSRIQLGTAMNVRGLACSPAGGALQVLIISWNHKAPATLAHEVIHTMALSRRAFDYDMDGGHTLWLTGFDETNLMWSHENATIGLNRDQLSLGQVFRINVDALSWINVERIGPVPGESLPRIRPGNRLRCQNDRETWVPCPPLAFGVGKQ